MQTSDQCKYFELEKETVELTYEAFLQNIGTQVEGVTTHIART